MSVRGSMLRLNSTNVVYLILAIFCIYWLLPRHIQESVQWQNHAVATHDENIHQSPITPQPLPVDQDREQTQHGETDAKPIVEEVPATQDDQKHPIKALHEEGMRKFEDLIQRQSKTLGEAVAEYKRRYKRAPPPGFNEWFDYAMQKDSAIIDDFDMINESMAPFWKLTPQQIKQVFERAAAGPVLGMLTYKNGIGMASDEENWMGERIIHTLKDIASQIPDFQILMNPLDEPRVLLTKHSDPDKEEVEWVDESQKSAWQRSLEPCKDRDDSRHPKPNKDLKVETHGLPFVTDSWTSIDVCQNPKFRSEHGFFIAPMTFITTNSPLPLLSQATPSTFSDILYPSMWYWDHVMDDLDDFDPPWNQKRNKIYWAGSTTGGALREKTDNEPDWESHRFRFIKITRQIGERAYSFLSRGKRKGNWIRYDSEEVLSQLYDTKFTKAVQCQNDLACESVVTEYQVVKKEDKTVGFKNRFLMDMDGNSFSGRFYNFVKSRSCPLKQTIFREWHDERLLPWVHFVPISISMEELPETMRYLALTTEGGEVAQKVASMGRQWHDKLLRREDAAVYLYRLFLEFARVSSPGRDERVLS